MGDVTLETEGVMGFEELYTKRYVALVHLASALVDDRAVAEEVVQECFGRLWERFELVDNPGGYLRTSVVNQCRQVLRRREVRRRHAPVIGVSAEPGEQDYLLDALYALPERRKTALVLRYYGGFTTAEIATTMDVAEGTVKSLIHRGLDQLREVVQ